MTKGIRETASRRDSTLSATTPASQQPPPGVYPQQMIDDVQNASNVHHAFSYSISPTPSSITASSHETMQVDTVRSTPTQTSGAPTYGNNTFAQPQSTAQPLQPPPPPQSDDMRYWNNMFRELGFGDSVDQTYVNGGQNSTSTATPTSSSHHPPPSQPHHQGYSAGRGANGHQPYAYHHMHSNAPGYGL